MRELCNLQFKARRDVPIGVHGSQRAIRFSAFQPPRTTPSLRDHDFRIAAARRREAAAQPDARRERRERALVGVDRSERERLRVRTSATIASRTQRRRPAL